MQQHYPLCQELAPIDNNGNYAQPIIQGQINQTQIIVNQSNPVITCLIDPEIFKTTPIIIQCPFCQNVISTNVKKSINCLSGVVCFFTGILFFILIQLCRKKSITCVDAVHICPKCGQKIGEYSSL